MKDDREETLALLQFSYEHNMEVYIEREHGETKIVRCRPAAALPANPGYNMQLPHNQTPLARGKPPPPATASKTPRPFAGLDTRPTTTGLKGGKTPMSVPRPKSLANVSAQGTCAEPPHTTPRASAQGSAGPSTSTTTPSAKSLSFDDKVRLLKENIPSSARKVMKKELIETILKRHGGDVAQAGNFLCNAMCDGAFASEKQCGDALARIIEAAPP